MQDNFIKMLTLLTGCETVSLLIGIREWRENREAIDDATVENAYVSGR